jgi:hypothetical protein
MFKGLQGGVGGKGKEGTLKIEFEHFVRFFCKNVAEMGPVEEYNVIKSGGKMKRPGLLIAERPFGGCFWKRVYHGDTEGTEFHGEKGRRAGGGEQLLNRKGRKGDAKQGKGAFEEGAASWYTAHGVKVPRCGKRSRRGSPPRRG